MVISVCVAASLLGIGFLGGKVLKSEEFQLHVIYYTSPKKRTNQTALLTAHTLFFQGNRRGLFEWMNRYVKASAYEIVGTFDYSFFRGFPYCITTLYDTCD